MKLVRESIKNLKNNILMLISGNCFIVMVFATIFQFRSLLVMIPCLLILSLILKYDIKYYKKYITWNKVIISALCILLFIPEFYEVYIHSSVVLQISNRLHLNVELFMQLLSLILFLSSIYFVSFIGIITYNKFNVRKEFNVLKNRLKEIKNLRQSFISILLIYAVSSLAILRANVLYADDMRRVADGNPYWNDFFRYISNCLSRILNTTNYITDISPLTQIIAIVFISIASVIIIIVFNKKNKISIWQIMSVVVLGLSPYFLECLSYKFDAPFMALSLLCAIIPLLFIKSSRKFYILIIFITTLIITMTYQASLGILPLSLIIIAYRQWCNGDNIKNIIEKLIEAGVAYVFAVLSFKFLLSNTLNLGEETYITSNIWTLKELPLGVCSNLRQYFNLIISDYDTKWLICIFFICMYFLYLHIKNTKQNTYLTMFIGSVVLIVTACLSYGVYMLLEVPLFQPRAFYGFGVWTAILCLIICSENLKIAKCVTTYFNFCFIVFAFTYGNVLAEQNRYVNFRINMVYSQLNEVSIDINNLRAFKIEGDIGDSPIIENIKRRGNILNRINRLGFSGRDYLWDKFYFQNYFGFPQLIYDEEIDYKKLPLVKDGYYSSIYVNEENLVIYLK